MPRKTPGDKVSPPPPPDPEEMSEQAVAALALRVSANPYAHLTQMETRCLFGFGRDFFRALVNKLQPPMAKGKMNPDHFKRWLWEHEEEIKKMVA